MAMSKPRRRWLWLLLPLAALIGFFELRALLEPERVSAFLLRQAEQATGLAISLDQPADIGIWPDLHLELIGLRATAPGASTPLLHARSVEVVLPWSALRSETLQLQRLRLIEPTLDMPALQAWLAQDDDTGPPAPLRLPQFDAAVEVEAGTVLGDGWKLLDVTFGLPSLRDGTATTLAAIGMFVTDEQVHGFDIRLEATPSVVDDTLSLKPFVIELATSTLPSTRFRFVGEVHYATPQALRFGLSTRLMPWPTEWPPLPFGTDASTPTTLQLQFAGNTDMQGEFDVQVSRGDDRIDASLTAGDLLAWAAEPATGPIPPLRGKVTTPRIEYEGIEATGVSLEFIDDDHDHAAAERTTDTDAAR